MSPQTANANTPEAMVPEIPAPQFYPQPLVPLNRRPVWPWPAFLLGVVALVGVWLGRPYWKPVNSDRVRQDLADARALLNHPTPDTTQAITLARRVLEVGPSYPHLIGEAHFLLGWSYLKKAEESPNPDADWREARSHLEQAESAGVSEADRPRLAYLMGSVLYQLRSNAPRALDYLMKADTVEEPATRWQMIAELCMRLPEPDVKGAIEATMQQIPHLALNDGRARAQAYYRLADLHLRLNQVGEAKRALEEIKAADSPELYYNSRVLLARCHQADGSYALAATLWEQIRSMSKPPIDRGTIQYELGFCYWKAGRLEEAKKAWDDAKDMGHEAAQASLLRKAELQLADLPNRHEAVATIEDALKSVLRPEDYRNSLYSRKQAEELVERACLEFKEAREWASASKLADLLVRLAGAARGKELAADIAVAWGLALQAEARQKSGQAARHAEEEAGKQFRLAGALAAELATPERPGIEQARWLSRAASCFLKSGDRNDVQNAVALLDRVQQLGKGTPLEMEVMYQKATGHEALGEFEQAIAAYRACLQPNHPMRHRARHQMARLILAQPAASREQESERLAEAAEELAHNLEPDALQSHPEEAENSAFLLGYVHFKRRDFVQAQTALTSAIERFPQSVEVPYAKAQLGRCYWFQAGKESRSAQNPALSAQEREQAHRRMRELLEKARQVAEPLEDELRKREQEDTLSENDQVVLKQVSFLVAECYFFMENFEEAVRRYNILALRYKGEIEELIALSQLWQCHEVYLGQREKGSATLSRLRDALRAMPDDVFDQSSELHRRQYWDDWLRRASPALAGKAANE
ncbi:MAG: tetratricopeptide repeat protein [Gemmataceae bacterium]|nr:tetratricopeptide repeat protein [Gemmataceae bacterium]